MKSKNKKRISAVKNNIYALKLLWKMSPSLVFNMAFSRFLGYFEWLFYSAFFMRYVINSLETQKSFSTIMTFIIVTVAVFASMSLYHSNMLCNLSSIKIRKDFRQFTTLIFLDHEKNHAI